MKIGITGAGGFIGKRLCSALEKEKHQLIKYDSDSLDITKEVKVADDIDVIYHLAALNKPYLSKREPAETFKVNVIGTLNLLEAARKANVKKLIFTSSVMVYRDWTKTKEMDAVGYNSIYPYGFEKLICEEYIKIYSELFGIDYVILRITGAFGPGMSKNPIFDIIQGFLNNNIELYVNRNSVYNFVHVDDVVDALVKSLNWEKDIFNVSADENVKIIDIYDFLSQKLNKKVNIKDTDFLMKIMGNNEKIKKKGWEIKRSLREGVWETYNYLSKKSEN